jgi:hypothetical protein
LAISARIRESSISLIRRSPARVSKLAILNVGAFVPLLVHLLTEIAERL